MKRSNLIISLLILPILLLIMSFIYKSSKGENYLQGFYDPSYVYLISSLNMSQLNDIPIVHIDHPGTPVQVTGAIIIRILHAVSSQEPDLVIDVFSRPEFYLNGIYFFANLVIAFALFLLGFTVFKRFHSAQLAFLMQLTPFFSTTMYFTFTNVVPELFQIFILLFFTIISLSFISEESMPRRKLLNYVLLFSLVCGFGMATKISFFPILIIPVLLIKRFSYKALFLTLTLIGFLIFVSPVLSLDNSARFLGWIKDLITHSEKYGKGPENFVNTSEFFSNLRTIFIVEPLFIFSYLSLAVVLTMSLIRSYNERVRKNKFYILAVGIFIAMTVQIIIVAKHFALYYLIPAMMLSVPALFIVNMILAGVFPKYFEDKRIAYLMLTLFIFLFFQFITIIQEVPAYAGFRDESHKILNYPIENYKNSPVVSTYGSSGRENALYLGIVYSGKDQKIIYDSVLKSLTPDHYYFDRWNENAFGSEMNKQSLKSKFLNSGELLFSADKAEVLNDFLNELKRLTNNLNISAKNLISNNKGETIYEIRLEK